MDTQSFASWGKTQDTLGIPPDNIEQNNNSYQFVSNGNQAGSSHNWIDEKQEATTFKQVYHDITQDQASKWKGNQKWQSDLTGRQLNYLVTNWSYLCTS